MKTVQYLYEDTSCLESKTILSPFKFQNAPYSSDNEKKSIAVRVLIVLFSAFYIVTIAADHFTHNSQIVEPSSIFDKSLLHLI